MYCKIAFDPVSDLDHHQGKPPMNAYCILPIPTLQRGPVTPWSDVAPPIRLSIELGISLDLRLLTRY